MNGLWKLATLVAGIVVLAIGCGDGGDGDEVTVTISPEATVLGASASPDDPSGTPEDPCTPQTYEVQSGDSLSQISVQFDVSVEAIAGASGISDPNVLQVGQELTIPCPGQLPATPQPTEPGESPTPGS